MRTPGLFQPQNFFYPNGRIETGPVRLDPLFHLSLNLTHRFFLTVFNTVDFLMATLATFMKKT